MRYKVYFKGDKCLTSLKGDVCILDMFKQNISRTCPIETGGFITLNNGDTLYINEQYGPLDPWETGSPEYNGIGLTLASGLGFIAWLIMPDIDRGQETGYGTFYDLGGHEYDDGNILRIYALPDDDYDTLQEYGNEGCYWDEGDCMRMLNYLGTIIIDGDNWVYTEEPQYTGNTVILNSGEEVFVSGPICPDGIGVCFTLSSGRISTAYYYRSNDDEYLAHSSYGWFSQMFPQDGDEIRIYVYDEGEDYDEFGYHNKWNDEEYIASIIPKLCVLGYDESIQEWVINEDYSND